MKLSEAFQTLGIPESSSQDEIKKAYRNLTKRFHPDVCKEPDAESKFKKINEAYSKIQKGPDHEDQQQFNPYSFNVNVNGFQGFNFHDFFTSSNHKHFNKPNINLSHKISFKDSIFGTTIPLKVNKSVKCTSCNRRGT